MRTLGERLNEAKEKYPQFPHHDEPSTAHIQLSDDDELEFISAHGPAEYSARRLAELGESAQGQRDRKGKDAAPRSPKYAFPFAAGTSASAFSGFVTPQGGRRKTERPREKEDF